MKNLETLNVEPLDGLELKKIQGGIIYWPSLVGAIIAYCNKNPSDCLCKNWTKESDTAK